RTQSPFGVRGRTFHPLSRTPSGARTSRSSRTASARANTCSARRVMEGSSCLRGGCRAQGPSQFPTEPARTWISRIKTRSATAIFAARGSEVTSSQTLIFPSRDGTDHGRQVIRARLCFGSTTGKAQPAGRLSSPLRHEDLPRSCLCESSRLRVFVVIFLGVAAGRTVFICLHPWFLLRFWLRQGCC